MAANPAVDTSAMPEFGEISLRALKLRPGMFLQTQRMEKNSPNYEAQFLGVIEGKCIMVVPVGTFSIKTGMKAGDTFVIRGFTGQYDFYFTSKVIQAFDFTFREPCYAYAVLSWPEAVEALVQSGDSAGAIGDLVSLEFSMGEDGALSYVVAVARICHIHIGDEGCQSGLLFETIAPSDRMLIREFVVSNAD